MNYTFDPLPINRFHRVPFMYVKREGDTEFYYPEEDKIPYLIKAFEFMNNGGSLRKACEWLETEADRKVSIQGLNNIWKRHHANVVLDRHKKLENISEGNKPKTKEARARRKKGREIGRLKRQVTIGERKLQQLVNQREKENEALNGTVTVTNDNGGFEVETIPETQDIVFTPNSGPQTDFLSASETEVLYGGSAGGGKSYALLADPMRYFGNKNFRGLLIRRTNDELRELKWKSKELYPAVYKSARWKEKDSVWQFPSGAELWMTYLERDEDVLRYQGQAFSWIGVDELTQYATPFAWTYLRSRLRSTDPTLDLAMRGTTNPGGPGHNWVKKMFIDPAPSNTSFVATDIDTGKELVYPETHSKAGKPLFKRRFIPASLYDNPYLLQDTNYEASLLSLPENQRRQLLEGDWTVADGAAFPEFRVSTHVVPSTEIPSTWRRFRSCDFGYSSYSAVHWFAVDPVYETLIVYRELYVTKHTGRDLAIKVMELERGEKISYGVLDSSVWHKRGMSGPSIAEEMIAEGCRWRPSDRSAGSRSAGKNRLHELLKIDPDTNIPGIVFHENCRQIISDLGVIPISPKGNEDIDERYASDHAYDSVRYGIMSRPKPMSIFEMTGMSSNNYKPSDKTFGY